MAEERTPDEIIGTYMDMFDDLPTITGLDDALFKRAMALLQESIELGVPYEDDTEFYEALGIDPPPDDAII